MRLNVASLRRVVKGDLDIQFVRQEPTSYTGLELLRRYLSRIGLAPRLRAAVASCAGARPRAAQHGRFGRVKDVWHGRAWRRNCSACSACDWASVRRIPASRTDDLMQGCVW